MSSEALWFASAPSSNAAAVVASSSAEAAVAGADSGMAKDT